MRIQRLSISEQIFDDITDKIKSGELQPGTKLVIANIQKEYGVSSTPVRDALNLLSAAGFVDFCSNSTACVAEMDDERRACILELYYEQNDMAFRILMRHNMIDKISEAMHEIYGRLLAQKGQPVDEIMKTFVELINTPGQMTGNPYYITMINGFRGKFVIAFGDYNRTFSLEDIYRISGDMINALDRKDYDAFQAARTAVYDCFQRTLQQSK